ESDKTYYIYDSENRFEIQKDLTSENLTCYVISIPSYIQHITEKDTINEIVSSYSFMLMHFMNYGKKNYRDTAYIKPKSFLKTINYYDDDWLSDTNNLFCFWGRYNHYLFEKDTLNIFLIKDIGKTDSVLIQKVNRAYRPAREGGVLNLKPGSPDAFNAAN
ncbi:MAG: hypothetical protein GXO47_08900, partial [Chlorobi bacterium]|nr:hypothetical protein [Chlorobiota bacterium]